MTEDSKKEIRIEDCLQGKAPKFPGKKSKDNKNGTELSKSEFIDVVIEDWIRHHFDNNREKYRNTQWAHKTNYLVQYLRPLGVARSEATKRLIKTETKLEEDIRNNEVSESQDLLSMDMDIETEKILGLPWDEMSRSKQEQEIVHWMTFSDVELFDSDKDVREEVKRSSRYKQREKAFFLAMSDSDLFERYFDKLSTFVKDCKEVRERYKRFTENYMDENFTLSSSQDILEKLSQTPSSVQHSDVYKERLRHLSFEERSQKLVMKNIKDTITALNKTPEGRKQAEIFIAGVSHPVYGDPGLGLSWSAKKRAKEMKQKLLREKEATLKLPEKKSREIFPKNVEEIARMHWIEITIPEPAKQTGKVVEEDGETVPTRYQDRTDRECYNSFSEDCADQVRSEMTKKSEELIRQLIGRPDTADKQRRMEYAQTLTDKFPGLVWYIKQRPKETKPLCDHTTGLCHLCEAAKKNFSFIVQAVKRNCSCGTTSCPNWYCACPFPEDGEAVAPCSCPPCECNSCSSCQVSQT